MENSFFEYLKESRKKSGFNITDLAKKIGISRSYLSNIENGNKGIPRPHILEKYSEALDIPYSELMRKAGYISNKNEVDIEWRNEINELLDHAFKHIVKNDNFIESCINDIKVLENKYEEILESNQNLTPQLIREFASEATWQQEWIFDLAKDLLVLSRKYDSQKEEILNFLDQPLITYNYQTLTNEDKQRIKDMLTILFPDKKRVIDFYTRVTRAFFVIK